MSTYSVFFKAWPQSLRKHHVIHLLFSSINLSQVFISSHFPYDPSLEMVKHLIWNNTKWFNAMCHTSLNLWIWQRPLKLDRYNTLLRNSTGKKYESWNMRALGYDNSKYSTDLRGDFQAMTFFLGKINSATATYISRTKFQIHWSILMVK